MHVITRTALFFALLTTGACGGDRAPVAKTAPAGKGKPQTAANAAPAVKKTAAVAECTGETPLKKGVPGSPGNYIPSTINPNGHSELAWLMRKMQTELKTTREAVIAGKPVQLDFEQHRIRCAWPSSMNDHNAAFDAMAVSYLRAVDDFNAPDASSPASAKDRFNTVVERCLNCHANTCEGPMVAIRPLKISD